jgi:hypothetical protein
VSTFASRMRLGELQVEDALITGPEVPVLHLAHLLQPRTKDELTTTLRLEVLPTRVESLIRHVETFMGGGLPVLMMSRRGWMSLGRGNLLLLSPGHWSCESVAY